MVDEVQELQPPVSRVSLPHGCESKVSGRGDCRRSSAALATPVSAKASRSVGEREFDGIATYSLRDFAPRPAQRR